MDSILAAARAGIVAKKTGDAVKVAAKPGRYSIGNSDLSVEWGWQVHPNWSLSSRDDYVRWEDDGPLYVAAYGDHVWLNQKRGRELIIEHFGLQSIADELPLAVIAMTSPAALFALRRKLETERGLENKNDMISDRGGDHCSAEYCA